MADMIEALRPKVIRDAIRLAGGGAHLAEYLGIERQAVYQWTRVPVEHVLRIENLTGIPCYRMRPDIYPRPRP